MTTRQQRRARERAPAKRKNRSVAFIASIVVLLMVGVLAAGILSQNPPDLTRGALAGLDHWHSTYRVEVCGEYLFPFPQSQGEIHTHGLGQIHTHPQSDAFANENANLGKFFSSVGMFISAAGDGPRTLTLPDGRAFTDGGTCPDAEGTFDVEVFVNDETIIGDPNGYIQHEGDEFIVRFGPELPADATPVPPPVTGLPEGIELPDGIEQPPGDGGAPADGGEPAPEPEPAPESDANTSDG